MKVVNIHRTPNAEVIEALSEAMRSATVGDTQSIALISMYSDGTTYTEFTTCDHAQTMIGAVEVLKARLVRQITDD